MSGQRSANKVAGTIADISSLRRTVAAKVTQTGVVNRTSTEVLLEALGSDVLLKEVQKCVPAGVPFKVEKLLRTVQTMVRRDEKLAGADPQSVIGAVHECASLGLMPGPMGHVYISARKKTEGGAFAYEAAVITGYKGLIALAKRGGEVASVSARIVTDREIEQNLFELYYEGDKDTLVHRPITLGEEGKPVLAYCLVRFKNGTFHVEVMKKAEIMKARDAALERWNSELGESPWDKNELEQWRYQAIRTAFKFLDLQLDGIEKAVELGDAESSGASQKLWERWDGNGLGDFMGKFAQEREAETVVAGVVAAKESGSGGGGIDDDDDPSAGRDASKATGT